jgi:hypothetical protein
VQLCRNEFLLLPIHDGRIILKMDISTVRRSWYTPVVGAVLKGRAESLAISGAAALQVGMVYAHLPGWSCPIKAVLGIPCPGCGLSTACSLLLHGQWREALKAHAFAPLFLAGVALIAMASLLPEKPRQLLVLKVSAFERRTGLMGWFLAGLFLYWGLRLLHLA